MKRNISLQVLLFAFSISCCTSCQNEILNEPMKDITLQTRSNLMEANITEENLQMGAPYVIRGIPFDVSYKIKTVEDVYGKHIPQVYRYHGTPGRDNKIYFEELFAIYETLNGRDGTIGEDFHRQYGGMFYIWKGRVWDLEPDYGEWEVDFFLDDELPNNIEVRENQEIPVEIWNCRGPHVRHAVQVGIPQFLDENGEEWVTVEFRIYYQDHYSNGNPPAYNPIKTASYYYHFKVIQSNKSNPYPLYS